MPIVDRRVVLHAGIATVPSTFGHPVHHILCLIGGAFDFAVGHPMGGPLFVLVDRLHEVVSQANREVRVLEHNRAVRFAIEVGLVAALLDQYMGFLLFFPLTLNKLHHIWMPNLERLHLGCPAGLAARFYDCGNLVVHSHERQRTARIAPTRELLAVRT